MLIKYRYVAFEGIDGAGKTTQLARLARHLEENSITPVRLVEPTHGPNGRRAREMLTSGQFGERSELHKLLMADRRAHIEQKIDPLLEFVRIHPGFAILQDRCYLSAPAYQGTDREDVIRLLREEQSYAPKPDAIVLLRVPPAMAVKRLRREGGHHASLASEKALGEILARYELAVEADTAENVLTIDGVGTEEEIHQRVVNVLEVGHEPTSQ